MIFTSPKLSAGVLFFLGFSTLTAQTATNSTLVLILGDLLMWRLLAISSSNLDSTLGLSYQVFRTDIRNSGTFHIRFWILSDIVPDFLLFCVFVVCCRCTFFHASFLHHHAFMFFVIIYCLLVF